MIGSNRTDGDRCILSKEVKRANEPSLLDRLTQNGILDRRVITSSTVVPTLFYTRHLYKDPFDTRYRLLPIHFNLRRG